MENLPGADAPDHMAPRITEPLKPLHHVKVAIRGALKKTMVVMVVMMKIWLFQSSYLHLTHHPMKNGNESKYVH